GGISITGTSIDVSTTLGAGGSITLDAHNAGNGAGTISFTGPMTLSVDGANLQNNGIIFITGSDVKVTGGDVTLSANGAGATSDLINGNITINTTTGGIATSGNGFAATAGHNVSIFLNGHSIDTTGGAAGGGAVSLTAGNSVLASGASIDTSSSN